MKEIHVQIKTRKIKKQQGVIVFVGSYKHMYVLYFVAHYQQGMDLRIM